VKVVAPLVFCSLLLIAAASYLAPPQWKWPAIGVITFFAFFISTRIIARLIGEETERRFDGKK
jgi:hypothetical protein